MAENQSINDKQHKNIDHYSVCRLEIVMDK